MLKMRSGMGWAVLVAVWAAAPCRGDVVEEAQKCFDSADYATVVALLTKEIAAQPGHEEAYLVLARAYEQLGEKEKAAELWGQLKVISRAEERISAARLGLLRTRPPNVPPADPEARWETDPFRVDVSAINWRGLETVADGGYDGALPKYVKESRHFVVFAPTEQMTEVGSELCEAYLSFLMQKYMDGQAWALRLPILIYKNHADYVSIGKNPSWSGGGTMTDPILGRPVRIDMFMLDESGQLDHDAMEATLPHELSHMVVHEFIGAQKLALWLDEGMARRMEQNRKHYEEAAKTGRDAVAGEYYRFRELTEQEGYPDGFFRVWRVYEQGATMVLYLLEQSPESLLALLESLKAGKSDDEAVAAALGIPVDGALEEFEKRWAEWVKDCYVHYRSKLEGDAVLEAGPLRRPPAPAEPSKEGQENQPAPTPDPTKPTDDLFKIVFDASFSELATAEQAKKWAPVRTDSLDRFKGLGESLKDWKCEQDRLVCRIQPGSAGSLLGVRMDEEPPMVLRAKVRAPSGDRTRPAVLGVAMLPHRADDTGIQVKVAIRDNRTHELTCVVTDEIAVYLDDACMGRAPALVVKDLDEDIDYPLALAAYAPVEVSEVRVAAIEEFVKSEPSKASPDGNP